MAGIRWRIDSVVGPPGSLQLRGCEHEGSPWSARSAASAMGLKGPFGSKARCIVLGCTPGVAGVVWKGEDIGLLLWAGKGIAMRQGKAQDGLTLRR